MQVNVVLFMVFVMQGAVAVLNVSHALAQVDPVSGQTATVPR